MIGAILTLTVGYIGLALVASYMNKRIKKLESHRRSLEAWIAQVDQYIRGRIAEEASAKVEKQEEKKSTG